MPTLEANRLLAAAVDAADSKKAEDIRILALDPSESSLTDYFLICSGTNERQNVAISDEIEYRLKKDFGVLPNSVEGRRQGEWVLMDYVDFVVHVFMPEKREFYGLERLRKTAKSISAADLNSEIKAAVAKTRAKAGTTAAKAPAAKKATAKKAAVKVVAKKAAPKKTAAKKAVAAPKKAVAKKAAKPAVKAPAAKKPATKKAAAKRTRK
ncbi:ribosome silencing factor [Terriglobus sp. ADX1]|uniref:ribosome silencing factor n=1 Tax=Terriglobus sp. ADX1 TaxID=2794063 RepID=UPI002FE63795